MSIPIVPCSTPPTPPDGSIGSIFRLKELLFEAIASSPIVGKQLPNVRHFAVFQTSPHDDAGGIREGLDPIQNAEKQGGDEELVRWEGKHGHAHTYTGPKTRTHTHKGTQVQTSPPPHTLSNAHTQTHTTTTQANRHTHRQLSPHTQPPLHTQTVTTPSFAHRQTGPQIHLHLHEHTPNQPAERVEDEVSHSSQTMVNEGPLFGDAQI